MSMIEEQAGRILHVVVALRITAALFIAVLGSSCTPVKGYAGPELPDTAVSLIEINYDSGVTDLSEAHMNGISFGSVGIKVLPGEQIFELEVGLKDPPDHCYSYPELNRSGLDDCLEKKESWKCDCWDYLSTYERCYRQVHDTVCRGTIRTAAGRQYELQVRKSERQGRIQLVEKGRGKAPGKADCQWLEQRTVDETNYIGSGRYTANSHGIYSCY